MTGVAGRTTALLLSNPVTKQLYRRRRPPSEWVPPDALRDRPESSSFPSVPTAFAFASASAFASAVGSVRPPVGASGGALALPVAVERVHSGARTTPPTWRPAPRSAWPRRPSSEPPPAAVAPGALTGARWTRGKCW
ncbi:hypothetical protein P9869_25725 [Streptomyces ossamyceticus]|nr:hypothetical protein [Streptomyces ossamyceticus]